MAVRNTKNLNVVETIQTYISVSRQFPTPVKDYRRTLSSYAFVFRIEERIDSYKLRSSIHYRKNRRLEVRKCLWCTDKLTYVRTTSIRANPILESGLSSQLSNIIPGRDLCRIFLSRTLRKIKAGEEGSPRDLRENVSSRCEGRTSMRSGTIEAKKFSSRRGRNQFLEARGASTESRYSGMTQCSIIFVIKSENTIRRAPNRRHTYVNQVGPERALSPCQK